MTQLLRVAAVLLVLGAVLGGLSCGGACSCSAECKAYVTCAEATGIPKGSLDSQYGAMGTCWTTTTQAATTCNQRCRDGVAGLRAAFPDAGC